MNIRLLGPTVAATVEINGTFYQGSPGQTYDVPDGDSQILRANGWTAVCPSGRTSERPPTPPSENWWAVRGTHYLDTSLSKIIVFDGATWRDAVTGSAV